MNFLELCADLHLQAGISGTAPSSVTGQTGENKRIVNWISRAWGDLQAKRTDWLFLRDTFTLTTINAQSSYAASDLTYEAGITSARLRLFDKQSLRIYKTSAGKVDEIELPFIPYEVYRTNNLIGQQVSGRPEYFTVDAKNNLLFDPVPDGSYTITGEFIKTPQILAGNTDIPEVPIHFHNLIVYRALIRYAYFEAASEVLDDAKMQDKALFNQLLIEQLPDVTINQSLMEE